MTQEGRPIKGVILSTGKNRPALWFDGGIHAREWVSPATMLFFLHKMTTGYGSDSTITTLLQTFDFYIFPLINPDGYAYTFTSDRLWRKNRSGGKRGCRGVDPNRNFDAAFGGAGTSGHPCSDIYRGARAFSEAESRAIRDAILALGSRVKGYVSVHSYSQLVMVPYGHGRATYTKDYADQIAAARAVSRAIQSRSGVYYQVGTISSLLGPAAGSSSDWAYDGAKIKYCIGVELRDKGRYGFLLPNFLIVPTADEALEGFKALAKFIARRELNKFIQWIDRERSDNQRDGDFDPRDAGSFRIDMYHTLDEIYGFLDSSAQKFPNIVTRVTIGKTEEGAAIRGVKISSGGNSSRPAIWIDSGIHAREWISTASALYIIDHMLKSYNDSDDVTKLVDTFDWYIFPVINADGYKYTWTTVSHRLWRKNRVRNVGSLCRGVDPNRNFDVRFGLAGSSANPCAENFAGTYPFSEPESRAIRDGINNLKDRLKAYINLHSYSQVVMIPYGYSKGYTSDYKSQYEALEKLVTAIRKRNSAFYRHGTAGQTLYITSGAALDWVYDKAKVKHTFVVELRDRGLFGFILPREFITPTGDELFSGVKALAFHIMKAELKSS
nr:carboxypeptidase A2-like [Rhipicephalus microplus]